MQGYTADSVFAVDVGKDKNCRHLDAETGLAPVTSLGVVSGGMLVNLISIVCPGLVVAGVSKTQVIMDWIRKFEGALVVPNGVSGSETNPLRDRAVLLLRLGKLLLCPERLVALYSG